MAELTARVVYGAELLLAQVKNKGPRGKAKVELVISKKLSKSFKLTSRCEKEYASILNGMDTGAN